MKIRLTHLVVTTRQTIEKIQFSESVTFLYGPVGTGKSTVARLIDYCFGGDLERTPAIQQEFVSVVLGAKLGDNECSFERGAQDKQEVRVTWTKGDDGFESVNAPIKASETPLIDGEVYNLSDLLFYLCGVEPIKVLKRSRDPESPMVRLSFRDIWWYCYLDQTHLDSSFFRLEDPFRGRKSQDAMRFFTGLHSERLSQLQAEYYRTITEQHGAREAVAQIRRFMTRFELGTELGLQAQIDAIEKELKTAYEKKQSIEADRSSAIHPTDELRSQLRELSNTISEISEAILVSQNEISEEASLRAELITAKVKSGRAQHARQVLGGVDFAHCPQCSSSLSGRPSVVEHCHLCGIPTAVPESFQAVETEAVRRELNDRIDQITDSLNRRRLALTKSIREANKAEKHKQQLDLKLQDELQRYDSAFLESIRDIDRTIATLEERLRSLVHLQGMPRAIGELEEQAGGLQGRIDRLRSTLEEERNRLHLADINAKMIATKFKNIMLQVGFPGVSPEDEVELDPRNWKPVIIHSQQAWGFWDTGSGGKKTLFNVCYALAVHEAAREQDMPVPNILIIDSPTKNISDDENPELVKSLYREIFRLAATRGAIDTQFILIDSDLVEPEEELTGFLENRMAGELDAPSLISYYVGP